MPTSIVAQLLLSSGNAKARAHTTAAPSAPAEDAPTRAPVGTSSRAHRTESPRRGNRWTLVVDASRRTTHTTARKR